MCSYSLCSECLQRIQIWRGDREIDPSTRREGRESWYLEIIDLNMVTITPLSSQLGQWGAQIICLLSNQQLLIEKSWSRSWSIRGTENIRYWATEQDLRAESGLAKLQFCAKFCANCHSANFSAVGRRTRPQSAGYTGRGEIVISTLGLRLRNEWTEEKRRVLNSQSVSAGSGPAGEDCGPGRPSGQTLLIPASDTRWRSPPGPPDTNHCNIIMSTLWQLTLITSFKLFHQISLSQHHSDASCDGDDDTDHYHDDDDDHVTWHWVPVCSISIDGGLCW